MPVGTGNDGPASLGSGRRLRFRGRPAAVQRQQLLAEDRDVSRRLDPQANLAAVDVDHGDTNVLVDVDLLTQLAAQNQHVANLLRASQQLCHCRILRHKSSGDRISFLISPELVPLSPRR